MNRIKTALLALLLLIISGCSSVKESEVVGTYKIVKPGYLALVKYVITDRIVGYRMGKRKLIFKPDYSFITIGNDTIPGNWEFTPDHKIQTTVNWNDSTYQNLYTSNGGKLYIVYTSFYCEDTARTKSHKSLTVYEKVKE